MSPTIKLFVIDAAPLINLAAAKSLDYLLYSGLPVVIPDAVFYEATASSGKLGAQEIIDWQRANTQNVFIETTIVFQNELIILEAMRGNPNYRPTRDLGERAATEIIQDKNVLKDDELALFLTDDAGARRFVTEPEKAILMTTSNYLQQLESAHRIQSADYIFEQVQNAGRNPPSHDLFGEHAPEIKEAVRNILLKKAENDDGSDQS